MKFAVSISIYCFTLIWMLTFVRGRRRLVALISWVTVVALFVEMVLIVGAAALGTTSHYNGSTLLTANKTLNGGKARRLPISTKGIDLDNRIVDRSEQ